MWRTLRRSSCMEGPLPLPPPCSFSTCSCSVHQDLKKNPVRVLPLSQN
jgi:hypothetical protein